MKKPFLNLLLLLISSISFAQGISVQGIARDNASSAITDTPLNFTFSITQDDNTVLYAETQSIKTDNYGVFSHIVRTGNPLNDTSFNDIDFKIEDLKLIVSVDYNSNAIEVYNQTFQYTPYAYFAKKAGNGVPTGSIMPYAGDIAPEGWVFCKGTHLRLIEGSAALIEIVGEFAPDLQGTFLRGTGISPTNENAGPELREHQDDAFKEHLHQKGTLNIAEDGAHSHKTEFLLDRSYGNRDAGDVYNYNNTTADDGRVSKATDVMGIHGHNITGNMAKTGGTETRPVNYGVNYIIKL
jgi:microcystin-dependent protein